MSSVFLYIIFPIRFIAPFFGIDWWFSVGYVRPVYLKHNYAHLLGIPLGFAYLLTVSIIYRKKYFERLLLV